MVCILVADDSPTVRLLIRFSLDPAGYQVVEAHDGEIAWRMLRQSPTDLAILDVRMAGLDGITLVRLIRADPVLARLPVLLLSGHTTNQMAQVGLAAGANRYLTKPFLPSELLAVVRQTLEPALAPYPHQHTAAGR